jgi:hypothetical protein
MTSYLKSFCIRALLALGLAGGAGAAFAGPAYHVAIDTTSLSGKGYLALDFAALAGATPASATLSHFKGAFGPTALTTGIVDGDVGSTLTFGNAATFNELLQAVDFGGLFSFDVSFDVADHGNVGTSFALALVNAALDNYASGTDGDLAVIGLMPGLPATVWADDAFATVNAVPEPAGAPLFAAGLLLLLLTTRRRSSLS